MWGSYQQQCKRDADIRHCQKNQVVSWTILTVLQSSFLVQLSPWMENPVSDSKLVKCCKIVGFNCGNTVPNGLGWVTIFSNLSPNDNLSLWPMQNRAIFAWKHCYEIDVNIWLAVNQRRATWFCLMQYLVDGPVCKLRLNRWPASPYFVLVYRGAASGIDWEGWDGLLARPDRCPSGAQSRGQTSNFELIGHP